MQFVNLTGSSTGTTISKSNNIIRLENRIESNIESFIQYHWGKAIKFNNSHTLSTICNTVQQYFGGTPEQTYENVRQNLRHIANLFNVVYPGVKQAPQDVLLGKDYLIHKEFEVTFLNGTVKDHESILKLYYHDQTSLRIQDYINGMESNSLLAIDIPLLASVMHRSKISKELGYTELDINEFITEFLIIPLSYDVINIALLNRFELDSLDLTYPDDEDVYLNLPYRHDSITKLYELAKKDYRQHFGSLTKTQLSDLYFNLPMLNSNTGYRIEVNDYYMDSLMWINAVSEVNLYNKLTALNDNYNLRLEVSTHENRLKKLLGRRRTDNLLQHLDSESKDFYSSILRR